MQKNRNKVVKIAGILFILAGLFGYFILSADKPPSYEMKMAVDALSDAKKAKAHIYSKQVFKDAEQAYDSAMICWTEQNKQFYLLRDYTKMRKWISIVLEKSEEAAKLSGNRAHSKAVSIKEGISQLTAKAEFYETHYKKFPLPVNVSSLYHHGIIKLTEAKYACENHRFGEAQKKYTQAEELINKSYTEAESRINHWFNDYETWQNHVNKAMDLSSNGKKVVVVDKLAHTCTVYRNRKALKSFSIDLGINWIGDKKNKGDKATPEGNYQVVKKKRGAETKFYKALLLNYPNKEDINKFNLALKNGDISKHTEIGSLIEIHGHGGKGIDWTDGCIALSNEDMDELYLLLEVGTPVIIVGSLMPFEETSRKSQKER
jgi:lipoprotein-anchoring transpeptidase ErfK/SrfK